MSTPLRVLILEDCSLDAELMLDHLRQAGFDPLGQVVDTEPAYLAQLDPGLDVVLADFSLPQFDARHALRLLKERGLDVPFIIVSGHIGEDVAVQCMRDGASDYLLKDRLARLGSAVAQALERKRLLEENRDAEERLLHEAFHDALTGLPNRALLLERLGYIVLRRKRDSAYAFSVCFLNLDGFDVVNDSLGHAAGDRLLIEVGRRLASHVRAGDTVACLGGSEFVVLLDNLKTVNNTAHVANRIQHTLAQPFTLDGRDVFLTASIGIASSTTGYDRADEVLRDAGAAMCRAKGLGKAGFVMFDTAMHSHAMARLQLEAALHRALEHQEFHLCYQPIVSLETGRISGFEALLRWEHPERGLVAPDEFIHVAEELGLIIPIGQWALREACRQLRTWRGEFLDLRPLTVSVNLSGRQFSHSEVLTIVDHALEETGLDASSLKLEITESVMMDNPELATALLFDLKARHIETCMDDFGTGYSSLSFLQHYPVDILKIDQSFISSMGVSKESSEIVRTIVTMAHNLGKTVIAEGVETAEHFTMLRTLQCAYGQGYFFSKPLDGKAAGMLLAARRQWCAH
jgi:diguanylate cyclase (GGDEF)-like protein